jgi:hypothetical protein
LCVLCVVCRCVVCRNEQAKKMIWGGVGIDWDTWRCVGLGWVIR